MITFFEANGRPIFHAMPKGSKSNEDYFIDNLISALNQVRIGNARHKVLPTLIADMDNSMRHNVTNITEQISLKGLRRAPHPAYSPDIRSCDFWTFGTIKRMIKDRHLQGPEEILRTIPKAWSHFTFEDFQNVFKVWMERLTWLIANNGEYCH
jgi:hypothetical protein